MGTEARSGFKIKSVSDGSLYRAQVERRDGEQFLVNGRVASVWETPQYMDSITAVGQAIYAIDSGKLK